MPRLPVRAKSNRPCKTSADQVSKFHASRQWKNIRTAYKETEPICERCIYLDQLTADSCRNTSVHHIEMVARNWQLRKSECNFITVCSRCHAHFSALERVGKIDDAETQAKQVKNRGKL